MYSGCNLLDEQIYVLERTSYLSAFYVSLYHNSVGIWKFYGCHTMNNAFYVLGTIWKSFDVHGRILDVSISKYNDVSAYV